MKSALIPERLLEKVRHQLVTGPHLYLLSLGIEHSNNVDAGRALLEPVLSRADLEQLPCYVESFDEGNLCFYQRLGFRIEAAGVVFKDGPSFWAMIRPPQSAPRSFAKKFSRQSVDFDTSRATYR
jgi:hypothetical protein